MGNEKIVATAIYYYDSENVQDSHLSFRMAVSHNGTYYEQNDNDGVKRVYGITRSVLKSVRSSVSSF